MLDIIITHIIRLNLFINEKYLYTFFSVIFTGFIALFAFLSIVVVEKTKYLISEILFNPHYINLGPTSTKEYKLWMYVRTFNPEIFRFFEWTDIEKLINPQIVGNYEGENYKNAFYRLKNVAKNFNRFFWITIFLLSISLISLFCMLFVSSYYGKLTIVVLAVVVFLLSFFSLIFAALVIKTLFLYGSRKEGEKLKKQIFK